MSEIPVDCPGSVKHRPGVGFFSSIVWNVFQDEFQSRDTVQHDNYLNVLIVRALCKEIEKDV
jgi:hypothetical protein